MNKPSVSIISPVRNAILSQHQYVNAIVLQMQNRGDWELILPVWGCQDDEPMKMHGGLSNEQTIVFNALQDTESSAINEGLKHARGDYIVVVDALTVLGVEFIPTVLSKLKKSKSPFVGVPVLLSNGDTPVREIGFNESSVSIESLGFQYGNIVIVGAKTAFPQFEECNYPYILHTCRCIELFQADVEVIDGNHTCAIQEHATSTFEDEAKHCDSMMAEAFSMGFSLQNTLSVVRLFSRRKALFTEFNERYDPTLNINEYINIFHRKPKSSTHKV